MEDGRIVENDSIDAAIRRCFGFLSEADVSAFERKFAAQPHDEDQVTHTFRELVLGAFLASNGLVVQSDRPIKGKAPDWSILENGELKCIVEVANFHASKATRDDIEAQLAKTGFAWVYQPDHSVRLYPILQAKCTAYTDIVNEHDIPYNIGLFLHFDAAVNPEQVNVCLFDAETGLFNAYPHVSGLLVFDEMAGCYRFNYIANQHAVRPFPLPEGALNLSLTFRQGQEKRDPVLGAMRDAADELDEIVAEAMKRRREGTSREISFE
jgi:hypothetical protein